MSYAKALLIVWALLVVGMAGTYVIFGGAPATLDGDREQAFQECLQEVTNNCGTVIGYATALETENAKLNRKLAELRSECTVIH